MQDIHSYYNELAPAYDASRFGNSYGRFLHRQEHRALTRYLNGVNPAQALDLACGTGRMLEFAATGCDASPGMLEEAKKKHPGKNLIQGDATCLPFPDASFDAVFSLHFFMHLDRATTRQVWQEIHRVLRPGGKFVFDFPSEKRRNFTGGHHRRQWHGSNALSMQFLLEQTPHQWRLRRS
ncbi:MAG: class I SAM-dependent methyltransferase, partial [Saprospiraceae bacterium]|nr:class I SAM-dependent methyltransferase [Saprospiraceae bacterium]